MQTTLAIPTPLTFKVPEVSYPRMRLSGSGMCTPSRLAALKHFVYVSPFLSEKYFPENATLCVWEDELVFFPVRRLSRVRKILDKLGLRMPTYHHAATFGLRVKDSPVAGSILFPHQPVVVPEMGECQTAFVLDGKCRYVCACSLSVFKQPIWAVGLA